MTRSAHVFMVWSIALVTCASAVDIYSTSFEDPPFANGSQLQGQDGWLSAADLPPFLNPTAAIITDADARTGSQSLVVNGGDLTSAVEVAPSSAGPTIRFITITFRSVPFPNRPAAGCCCWAWPACYRGDVPSWPCCALPDTIARRLACRRPPAGNAVNDFGRRIL